MLDYGSRKRLVSVTHDDANDAICVNLELHGMIKDRIKTEQRLIKDRSKSEHRPIKDQLRTEIKERLRSIDMDHAWP